jgi:CHAT domain-containing protein
MRAFLLCLLLPGLAVAAAEPPLPDAYASLIRSGNYDGAYALGARELAQSASRKIADANDRCAILDRMARVQLFDFADPDTPRQEQILEQALACHAALPNDAANGAKIAWLTLRQTSLEAMHGKAAETKAAAQQAEGTFLRSAGLLSAFDRAAAYHALGSLATSRGEYVVAATRYAEGVAAAGARDAAARAERARIQMAIGAVVERGGRFAEAVDADRLALQWVTESFGERSLLQASAFGTLAQTEFFCGHYADALDHAERGIRVARSFGIHGKRALTFMLTTLGNVLRVTGELARARDALTEALALERSTPDPNIGALASRLNQLGYAEELASGCDTAMPRYREALELGETQFGKDNVRIEVSLTNLGGCELKLGHFDASRALFDRSLAIVERTYGKTHPATAKGKLNLAAVSLAQHAYAQAQAQLHDALSLLPADADALATTSIAAHRALAQALHGLGRDDDAFTEATIAETARQTLLRKVGANLSETNALAFKGHLEGALDLALALAAKDPRPTRIATAWRLQVGARQLVTGLVAERLKAVRRSADKASEQAWRNWEAASNAYGEAVLARESGKADADTLRLHSEALDQAERALAHQLGASAQQLAEPPDIATLQRALPRDSALVAYAVGDADPWDDTHLHASRHLYALRLLRDGEPRLLDLGDMRAIDAAIHDWTVALRDPNHDGADLVASGMSVRGRIIDPIALPAAARRIFIVPEGDVHRVAWLALPIAQETWAEHGIVAQLLGNERELSNPRVDALNGERLLLVGAPSLRVAGAAAANSACPQPARELAGATRELGAVQSLWQANDARRPIRVLDGRRATKDAVRAEAEMSRTLHFATHAFAGDSPCLTNLLATRSVRLSSTHADAASDRRARGRDLTGLILAAPRTDAADGDNGILTAAEIAALKLDGVDGVTLAACDTGLGPILPDEGVFGLARAFRVAGARSVVMSLWQIDDDATADLMQRFYRTRFASHTDAAEALASAARETLLARRAAGQSTHPYYWAAFVASGDWRASDHE